MKISTVICYLLFLAGVVLFLLQMWFKIWGAELFSKIIITDVALFAIVFMAAFLIKESKATNKITKGKNSLD